MELTIKKVKRIEGDAGLYCQADCISTIANYVGKDYELTYLDGWNFNYSECIGSDIQPIANNIELYEINKLKNLDYYHGIQLSLDERNSKRDIERLIDIEKQKKLPILVSFDSFWCPWDWGYQKYHNTGHYFLIIDIDHYNDELICIDPYFNKVGVRLPFECFDNGIKKVFTISLTNIRVFDEKSLIDRLVINSKKKVESNYFLTVFSEDIAKRLDLELESEGFDSIFTSKLNGHLIRFMQTRCNYSIALRYLGERLNSEQLIRISEEWWGLGIRWMSVRKMIYKLWFVKKNKELTRKQISHKILQISKLENELLFKMQSITTSETPSASRSQVQIKRGIYNFLKLKEYFNNKAFGKDLDANWKADFTGDGHYYLLDKKAEEIMSKNNNMFYHPGLFEDRPDNISCNGQVLKIKPARYSSIIILASSEFGNTLEELTAMYEDGTSEKIRIAITDYILEPQFGEKIIWKGKAAYKSVEFTTQLDEDAYLFGSTYYINNDKNLYELILPYYPSLHIFSITLES